MSDQDLSTYTEMVDVLERLPQIVRDARRARGISLRAVGRESGISNPALSQFENGHHTLGGAHTIRLLKWLDQTTPTPGSESRP